MTIHGIDNCHCCGEPMGETACPKCGWFDATLSLGSEAYDWDIKQAETGSDPKADIDAAVEHIKQNCGTMTRLNSDGNFTVDGKSIPHVDMIGEKYYEPEKEKGGIIMKTSKFIFWLLAALGVGMFIGAQFG